MKPLAKVRLRIIEMVLGLMLWNGCGVDSDTELCEVLMQKSNQSESQSMHPSSCFEVRFREFDNGSGWRGCVIL